MELAKLCSRIENDWVGAQTGLLDQITSLFGERGRALLIDFRSLEVRPSRWSSGGTLVTLDSGERHTHAAPVASGYNERRAQCGRVPRAARRGESARRDARDGGGAPRPARARARHVITENARVEAAVAALSAGDIAALGPLLDASHASLRDDYEVSTPAVEATVARLHDAGARRGAHRRRRLRRPRPRADARPAPRRPGRARGGAGPGGAAADQLRTGRLGPRQAPRSAG